MGVYGPQTQVKHLFKALVFLIWKKNIIINIIFPHEISSVLVTSFDSFRPSKWQNVHKFGVCGQFRDFKVTLKLKLQT